MNDTISRKAAYEVLTEYYHHKTELQHKALWDALSKVPPDNSERKRGKWDFIGDQMFRCTCCGEVYSQQEFESLVHFSKDSLFPGYCPNCGADMKGEQNE